MTRIQAASEALAQILSMGFVFVVMSFFTMKDSRRWARMAFWIFFGGFALLFTWTMYCVIYESFLN
jgi:putative flippase GtrA